jgi:hypothetical protein
LKHRGGFHSFGKVFLLLIRLMVSQALRSSTSTKVFFATKTFVPMPCPTSKRPSSPRAAEAALLRESTLDGLVQQISTNTVEGVSLRTLMDFLLWFCFTSRLRSRFRLCFSPGGQL